MAFESDYGGFSFNSGSLVTGVSSVFGRTGAVIANSADYAAYYYAILNATTPLVDQSTIDIPATKCTLASSAATRTFTISYAGDYITIELTLSAITSVLTFPATALCVSEGMASGDNTCTINGVSGDKYIIAIEKIGSNYYVVAKNFGQ